jgi:peptide methionine sulfoxide reductase msrA/msrB
MGKIGFVLMFIPTFFTACSQVNEKKETGNKINGIISNDSSSTDYFNNLTELESKVLLGKGTEKAFSGDLLYNKEKGVYECRGCGAPLFSSKNKFESGTGWPSFDQAISEDAIKEHVDNSHGMERIEITCANCGGHLGHVFDDGPTKTGLRYCVNSCSLDFDSMQKSAQDTITLGGGCFWCVEAIYELLDGVISVESGYSGGTAETATYKKVSSGTTNHAEVVQVVYDPSKVSLYEILEVFFSSHDPTTLNRQGADYGTQYRSVVFYHNKKQKEQANEIIKKLTDEKIFDAPIVTEISAFSRFYSAEKYHQDYYANNPKYGYCHAVITPKVEKFKKVFADKLKNK